MKLVPICRRRSVIASLCGLLVSATVSWSCTPQSETTDPGSPGATSSDTEELATLSVGAIPDQDPEKLQRLYGILSDYLSEELGVPVSYEPVTDYAAAVTAFKVGDLDLVWFGGLTGVQARLQVPAADAIAQRDIDAEFHSIFIANTDSGLSPLTDAADLANLKGKTITFGSESSTSGRLMPQYFLQEAGVALSDFQANLAFRAPTTAPSSWSKQAATKSVRSMSRCGWTG